MRKFLLVIAVATGAYFTYTQTEVFIHSIPCKYPITYNIGSLDKRFNLSQADLLKALSEAEAIWEKPIGKELFAYNTEKADLPVNLIYDYRQETTNTLDKLENVVEQSEAAYRSLQTKYNNLKSQYESLKTSYDTQVAEFNVQNEEYEQEVDAWNSGPRTSKSQFNKIEQDKAALANKLNQVKQTEGRLNTTVRDLNNLVEQLNSMAKTLNLNVDKYNTVGAERGDSFTGGLYYSTDGKDGIDIYEFSNHSKLVRVLAHEMGHALGLEHLDDPKAVMYYLNHGTAPVLTQTDIAALKQLCRVE